MIDFVGSVEKEVKASLNTAMCGGGSLLRFLNMVHVSAKVGDKIVSRNEKGGAGVEVLGKEEKTCSVS